ncbi:TetR family transcriptional regulator [Klebsiella pneumoniae]|nr:TetR family transcriptional regulator [Klebsiella pneumoniae]
MSETPRQKGRPKDPLKTQAILQAARKLFLEQGLEVTTAEIARVAGVAKATLYANFSDKEHLIEAVLRQESDLTISDHDFAQRHHLPLIEVLTAFGYRFVRFINQRELTGWDRLIASAAVRHPDLPAAFTPPGRGARSRCWKRSSPRRSKPVLYEPAIRRRLPTNWPVYGWE